MNAEKTALCKQILGKSFLFHVLDSDEFDKLFAYTSVKSFKRNEFIFFKGDEGGQLYAIISGTVRINTPSSDGKEITLAIFEQGDIFGEMAMFENECRTADAVMHASGEMLIIEHHKFKLFLEQTPKIAVTLIQTMCKRLRETNELLEDTLFLNLRIRLAKKVLALADLHGTEKNGIIIINLKLSQTELGNFVNSSRESINKVIHDWKKSAIIDFKNGFISIKNIDALEQIVDDSV